jgi:hypothetical protein
MKHEQLIAIDIHTHAEVSCWNPFDNYAEEIDRAADKYFKTGKRPTIGQTIAKYRELNMGLVMFTVDSESNVGKTRIRNEEIASAARDNADIMIAFASIDPHKGKLGAREALRLIEQWGVRGFKFHPTMQGFHPYDRMAWPLYEIINAHKLPAIFHTGHSGMGSGVRSGAGLRLEYSNPMHLDDVAIAFPDMQIVMAHPSWPWQDEALSVAMHKPNVWIDLSGWSPKYFPKQLVQYANTLLRDRVLFGSDFPLISPERWIEDAKAAGFKEEVMPAILKDNAVRLLQLG